MSDFKVFREAVAQQFSRMAEQTTLYKTDVDKDTMWEIYLTSFPEGSNPIFRERTEHDCQCCKQFIRAAGNVVAIGSNNELISIWDNLDLTGPYAIVAKAMSNLVKMTPIKNIFVHYQKDLGTLYSIEDREGSTIRWEHFHYELPKEYVMRNDDIGTYLSKVRTSKEVFKRALDDIPLEAMSTVLELIYQDSIYKGIEFKHIVEQLAAVHGIYYSIPTEKRDNYLWSTLNEVSPTLLHIRNSLIGTLLVDISEGVPLDVAVAAYESKAAPENYKRSSAVVTKSMIKKAQEKVTELGLVESLSRRYAVEADLTINNVLFADRSVKPAMNAFDEMIQDVPVSTKSLGKVEEVSIDTFINDILPQADSLEMMFENKHLNNLMSLIAPQDTSAKGMFKWSNNFSWAYNGDVTDSMKQRVKSAGGKVDGVLRFSIQWNDGDNNQRDFDAHCVEPDGNIIKYNRRKNGATLGNLDVDITDPGSKVAVENITWPNKSKMLEGEYQFFVHNYSALNSNGKGFTAEIEYDGKTYSFTYDKGLKGKEKVMVAELMFSKKNGITFDNSLPHTEQTKQVWGINTNQLHKVKMVMNSPNHWDGECTGNKHYMFMLEGCAQDGSARGFFNEFLKEDLKEHRKVFEILGSKMMVKPSNHQLAGLGFSSTKRDSVLCKVTGAFTRTIKINF